MCGAGKACPGRRPRGFSAHVDSGSLRRPSIRGAAGPRSRSCLNRTADSRERASPVVGVRVGLPDVTGARGMELNEIVDLNESARVRDRAQVAPCPGSQAASGVLPGYGEYVALADGAVTCRDGDVSEKEDLFGCYRESRPGRTCGYSNADRNAGNRRITLQ